MKIGVDIDEVLAEYIESVITFFNKKTGRSLKKEDFKTYNFWETWGGTREEAIKLTEDFFNSELFDLIEPIKDSKEAINNLFKNHEIFFITSRPFRWKEKTEKWIIKHINENPKIIFSSDFHTGQGKTKSRICKEHGIDLIMEDNGKYATECAEEDIPSILFNKPWNQGVSHNNLIRVNNWKEALKEIEDLSKTLNK